MPVTQDSPNPDRNPVPNYSKLFPKPEEVKTICQQLGIDVQAITEAGERSPEIYSPWNKNRVLDHIEVDRVLGSYDRSRVEDPDFREEIDEAFGKRPPLFNLLQIYNLTNPEHKEALAENNVDAYCGLARRAQINFFLRDPSHALSPNLLHDLFLSTLVESILFIANVRENYKEALLLSVSLSIRNFSHAMKTTFLEISTDWNERTEGYLYKLAKNAEYKELISTILKLPYVPGVDLARTLLESRPQQSDKSQVDLSQAEFDSLSVEQERTIAHAVRKFLVTALPVTEKEVWSNPWGELEERLCRGDRIRIWGPDNPLLWLLTDKVEDQVKLTFNKVKTRPTVGIDLGFITPLFSYVTCSGEELVYNFQEYAKNRISDLFISAAKDDVGRGVLKLILKSFDLILELNPSKLVFDYHRKLYKEPGALVIFGNMPSEYSFEEDGKTTVVTSEFPTTPTQFTCKIVSDPLDFDVTGPFSEDMLKFLSKSDEWQRIQNWPYANNLLLQELFELHLLNALAEKTSGDQNGFVGFYTPEVIERLRPLAESEFSMTDLFKRDSKDSYERHLASPERSYPEYTLTICATNTDSSEEDLDPVAEDPSKVDLPKNTLLPVGSV